LSRERYKPAGAETVENVEGNMLRTVMRGATALPWSKTPLRSKGTRRNLGDLMPPAVATAIPGRFGKARSRSRIGRYEESDGRIVPMKPRTTPADRRGRRAWREGGRSKEGRRPTMPRTQRRNWHVPDGQRPRIGTIWAAQAPNAGRVGPSTRARCGKAARRDLRGGREVTSVPTATRDAGNTPKQVPARSSQGAAVDRRDPAPEFALDHHARVSLTGPSTSKSAHQAASRTGRRRHPISTPDGKPLYPRVKFP
jgi:hypothetical protein